MQVWAIRPTYVVLGREGRISHMLGKPALPTELHSLPVIDDVSKQQSLLLWGFGPPSLLPVGTPYGSKPFQPWNSKLHIEGNGPS